MAKQKKSNKLEDKVMSQVIEKLDKLDDRLDSMDKTLVKQEVNLKEHMRRTALLEDELKPVKKHVSHVEGAFKLLGALSLIGGLLKLFGIL